MRIQRTTTLRQLALVCGIAFPALCSFGHAPNWNSDVQGGFPGTTAQNPPPPPPVDPDQEYWQRLEQFLQNLCRIMKCEQLQTHDATDHQFTEQMVQARIDSYHTFGLKNPLSEDDISQGIADVSSLFELIEGNPEMLSGTLETEFGNTLGLVMTDLENYRATGSRNIR